MIMLLCLYTFKRSPVPAESKTPIFLSPIFPSFPLSTYSTCLQSWPHRTTGHWPSSHISAFLITLFFSPMLMPSLSISRLPIRTYEMWVPLGSYHAPPHTHTHTISWCISKAPVFIWAPKAQSYSYFCICFSSSSSLLLVVLVTFVAMVKYGDKKWLTEEFILA